MSRKTLVSLLLVIVSALLAVALFIAGAMWRGRVAHTTDKTKTSQQSDDRSIKTGYEPENVHDVRVLRMLCQAPL
jgi:FtsZ-interacting cell division protein ZipA